MQMQAQNTNVKYHNKNLLFFTESDKVSEEFLTELNKNQPLKNQFILINQTDRRISLPNKIRELNDCLILIVNGSVNPILGKDAVYWLLNNGFSSKSNGLDYCNLGKNDLGAFIDDKQNSGLNGGGGGGGGGGSGGSGGVKFSFLGETTQTIDTYADTAVGKTGKSTEIEQRLNKLKTDRNQPLRQQMPMSLGQTMR